MNSMKKNETMMKFKMLFEGQKESLLRSTQTTSKEFTIQSEDLSDEADLTSVELEQNIRLKLRAREAIFVKKLDESLLKIQNGTFGMCECCEEEIELSRLEVRPTASLCISCKENEEAMEHRSADSSNGRKVSIMRIA